MSVVLFLTSDDFYAAKGVKGPVLCHKIPSFSLILFYSTKCPHCTSLIPIFKELPGKVANCQFGFVNVSSPKGNPIINMSKNTINPIQYVPYICLYVNGRPYMKYNGPADFNQIKRFVVEVAMNIQKKQQVFSQGRVSHTKQVPYSNQNSTGQQQYQDEELPIPEYTVGVPVCGKKNVCYLTARDVMTDCNIQNQDPR